MEKVPGKNFKGKKGWREVSEKQQKSEEGQEEGGNRGGEEKSEQIWMQ